MVVLVLLSHPTPEAGGRAVWLPYLHGLLVERRPVVSREVPVQNQVPEVCRDRVRGGGWGGGGVGRCVGVGGIGGIRPGGILSHPFVR